MNLGLSIARHSTYCIMSNIQWVLKQLLYKISLIKVIMMKNLLIRELKFELAMNKKEILNL